VFSRRGREYTTPNVYLGVKMMDILILEKLLGEIEFEQNLIKSSLVSVTIASAFTAIVILFGFFYRKKKDALLQRKNRILATITVAVIFIAPFSYMVYANRDRMEMVSNLKKDLEQQSTAIGIGVVASKRAYEKGGTAVVVNGDEYYVLTNIGAMRSGRHYEYVYLINSNFIVDFTVMDATPIPDNAQVSAQDQRIFGEPSYRFPLSDLRVIDEVAFDYLKKYYSKTMDDSSYNDFILTGWSPYGYAIETPVEGYRTDFSSTNTDEKIYLIFSRETGEVLYFWTE
jgi:hypothetical protein